MDRAEVKDALGVKSDSPTDNLEPQAGTVVDTGKQADTPLADTVSKAEFDAVLTRLQDAGREIQNLKEIQVYVEKAKQIFGGQPEGTPLSERDQTILKELKRLVPGLQYLDQIPKLVEGVKEASAQAGDALAEAAWAHQINLQKEHDLAPADRETSELIGGNIRSWMEKDQSRLRRYFGGDKDVIREGFEYVVGKLYGPARLQAKRQRIDSVRRAPIVPTSRGSAGSGSSGEGGGKIDFQNKKDVKTALRAAFEAANPGE